MRLCNDASEKILMRCYLFKNEQIRSTRSLNKKKRKLITNNNSVIRSYQAPIYLKPIALPRRLVLILSLKDGVKLFFLALLNASTLM